MGKSLRFFFSIVGKRLHFFLLNSYQNLMGIFLSASDLPTTRISVFVPCGVHNPFGLTLPSHRFYGRMGGNAWLRRAERGKAMTGYPAGHPALKRARAAADRQERIAVARRLQLYVSEW